MTRPFRPLVAAAVLLAAGGLGACAADPGTSPEVPDTEPGAGSAVETAYVLLAEGPDGATTAYARILVAPGTPCPALDSTSGGGTAVPTTRRDNPHGFAIDVCEAGYPLGESLAVAGTSIVLPAVTDDPRRVTVLGDSGCKPKDQGGCTGTDPSAWPLPAIASAAAASPPDVVLHMGDYNYRGTPAQFSGTVNGKKVEDQWNYDAGDGSAPSEKCEIDGPYFSQNQTGSDDPDTWENWKLDFFAPARPLLEAAPWVFARGNHELCSRAGPGWLYFLGPSSNLPAGGGRQVSCPSQDGGGPAPPHLVFVEPYTVELGDLAVSVLDTANACDELANFTDAYREQLASLVDQAPGAASRWLMMHRPMFGVDGSADGPPYACDGNPGTGPTAPYAVINRTLQCALEGGTGNALLPELDLLLAGHMHRFEWLEFAAGSSRPPMLVVGNSGVELSTSSPQGDFAAQPVDGVPGSGFALEQFGYVEMVRDGGAWRGEVMALDPSAWSRVLPACDGPETASGFLCVRGMPTR